MMVRALNEQRPLLPPGSEWADEEEVLAVALAEMERCTETLIQLAALDAGECYAEDGRPRSLQTNSALRVLPAGKRSQPLAQDQISSAAEARVR